MRAAMDQLNQELLLGATGEEQDWEIELCNPERLSEFISEYHSSSRSAERDFALVGLIIASFDCLVSERLNSFDVEYYEVFQSKHYELHRIYVQSELDYFDNIKRILVTDLNLHAERLKYWSCMCEYSDGEPFATTPLFQNMLMQIITDDHK